MSQFRLRSITLLLAALSMAAQAASVRETVTTARIAAAITDAGLQVSAAQVTLLSEVVAKTSSPLLKVESIGPWEGDRSSIRLHCVVSEECVPFVVTVSRKQQHDLHGEVVSLGRQPSRTPAVEAPKNKVVVRSGSPAVLLLDGGHVHIQLAVVCLESGVVGQTIRVAGRGHEQIYMAEVCSDGLLRGSL